MNALTYAQLAAWGKTIQEKTGQRRVGFPAGPKGLFARFLQGNLYPSYTASMVSEYRSAEAEAMWGEFKALWATVNPNSTNYDFMQEPLLAGEVWIAWDHIARREGSARRDAGQVPGRAAAGRPEGPRLHAGDRRPRHRQGRAEPGRRRRADRAPDQARRRR